MDISNIQDARAFKRMGIALNTPTKTHTFSAAYSERWLGMMKAHDKFCGALAEYIDDSSAPRWRKLCKSVDGIFSAMERADAAIDEFSDQNEKVIMARFVIERAIPFAEYWAYGLDAVEDGATLTINPADWPRWTE